MTSHEQDAIHELRHDLKGGRMTRGAFVAKGLAMGLSLTVIDKLLSSQPAEAMRAERELMAAGKTYQYWTPFAGADGPHMKLMVDHFNSSNAGAYFNFVR